MNQQKDIFPFTAIVGQADFKLALILNIVDPSLGGVLAIGDKGTGKTTLIRSLANLIAQQSTFPFVNLPIGASEDRVLGHINLEKLINDKKEHVQLGLLAKAHQGCLYIDEINLLNDYLMDLLLDASASGFYHLEREGISKKLNSRFCLIGSMNPEEGDLRPQLKDRFGLSVNINTIQDLNERQKIIENRLAFDDNPSAFVQLYAAEEATVFTQINEAKKKLSTLNLESSLYQKAAEIAMQHQVEGHRADVLLIKTARAYAAYLGDELVTESHLLVIVPFVLNHRSNKKDAPKEQKQQEQEENQQESINSSNQNEAVFQSILPLNERKKDQKRTIKSTEGLSHTKQNQTASHLSEIKQVDNRKTVGQYLATDQFELQHKNKNNKAQQHLIFLLDSSGSMLKEKVIAYAKGLVEKFAKTEVGFKPMYSLLFIYNGDVELVVDTTINLEVLLEQLNTIKTGGKTTIVPAFKKIKELTNGVKNATNELIIITDGKFNSEVENPFDEAVMAYQTYCKSIQQTKVIDAEKGVVKLAQAKKFAEKINANYESLILQYD